ncbi:hypothetical protein B0H14DRAFT_2759052 [Mycena olivaceomarginata]|nr:hypothetical protein B0H14DRAFT_2759052 [Mycena olivaceomarginata]
MSDVRGHTARLIALFVSCVLYGILLTTFVPCLHSLLFSASQKFQFRPRHEIKFPILVATVFMFLVSSFSAVLYMQSVIDGFIDYGGPGVEDTVQVIVGDALVIYRCYVLYDRNWRAIIAPAVAWLALVRFTSITSSYRTATLAPGKSISDPSLLPFLSATLVFTFLTSIITTYLIIRRLFGIERQLYLGGVIPPHLLTRIVTIFLETGLIYTLSVVASLGVYFTGSNLEFVAALAPITCNLLLIRVDGVNHGDPLVKIYKGSEVKPSEGKFNPMGANEV